MLPPDPVWILAYAAAAAAAMVVAVRWSVALGAGDPGASIVGCGCGALAALGAGWGAMRGGGTDGVMAGVMSLAIAALLAVVAIVDARTRLVPLVAVAALACFGLLRSAGLGTFGASLGGAAVAFGLFGMLWLVARMLRPDGEAFGGGDVLLAGAIGAIVGWPGVLGVLFLASLLGAGYGVWLIAARGRSAGQAFPFGVPLCLAALAYGP